MNRKGILSGEPETGDRRPAPATQIVDELRLRKGPSTLSSIAVPLIPRVDQGQVSHGQQVACRVGACDDGGETP